MGIPRPVAIVVPAHNEAPRIGAVLGRLPATIADSVLVVDDGSSDATRQEAVAAGARVLRHIRRRGYGAAQRTGLRAAREGGARSVLVLHADGQYPPESAPALLEPLEAGADVASGVRRHGPGYPLHRRAGERVLDLLLSRSAGLRLRSFSSGLRAYGPRALEEIPWEELPDGYGFDAAALLESAWRGLRIEEVLVPHAAGHSGLRPWRYARDVLRWARNRRVGESVGAATHPGTRSGNLSR